jgi:1-phosphofructokinase
LLGFNKPRRKVIICKCKTSDAFRLAVASGSATAFTKDLAEKKAMETLFEKVAVDVTDF